jgi:hypothetical protein
MERKSISTVFLWNLRQKQMIDIAKALRFHIGKANARRFHAGEKIMGMRYLTLPHGRICGSFYCVGWECISFGMRNSMQCSGFCGTGAMVSRGTRMSPANVSTAEYMKRLTISTADAPTRYGVPFCRTAYVTSWSGWRTMALILTWCFGFLCTFKSRDMGCLSTWLIHQGETWLNKWGRLVIASIGK